MIPALAHIDRRAEYLYISRAAASNVIKVAPAVKMKTPDVGAERDKLPRRPLLFLIELIKQPGRRVHAHAFFTSRFRSHVIARNSAQGANLSTAITVAKTQSAALPTACGAAFIRTFAKMTPRATSKRSLFMKITFFYNTSSGLCSLNLVVRG